MAALDELLTPVPNALDDLLKPTPERAALDKTSPSFADYARGLASGVNNIITTAGEGLNLLGAEKIGKAVREFGQSGEQYWQEAMTPAGKEAAGGDLENRPLSTIGMAAAQSLPGMAAMFVPGLGATKALQAANMARPVFGALKDVGVGAKRAATIARAAPVAVGMGASEGVYSGLSNAAQTAQEIAQTPIDQLSQTPAYRAIEESNPNLVPEEIRNLLSAEAERQVALRTAPWTGAVGALTGGGILGQIAQKATGGVAKNIVKGAAKEAGQEIPQSGGEAYIQNVVAGETYDPSRPAMQDVAKQAIIGGGAGGLLGGLGGGVHALSKPQFTPHEELLNKTAETVIATRNAETKLTTEVANDRQNQRTAAGKKTKAPAAEEAGAPGQAVLTGGIDEAALSSQPPVIDKPAPAIVKPTQAISGELAVNPPIIPDETPIAPKTVAGEPVAVKTDDELRALAVSPETPAITRHAAATALQARVAEQPESRQTAPGEALPAPATTIPAQPVAPQEATKAQPPAISTTKVGDQLETRSFAELARLSDGVQTKIDDLHDELEKKGIPFDEQNKMPEVEALYAERIKYDAAAAQKGYVGARSVVEKVLAGMPQKTIGASVDSILRERYSLTADPGGVYMMAKYTGKAIDSPKTLDGLSRDIGHLIVARDYQSADYDLLMESNMSALTSKGKAAIIREAAEKAKAINEGLRDFFTADAKAVETTTLETKTPPDLLQKSGVIPDSAQKSGPGSSGATITPAKSNVGTSPQVSANLPKTGTSIPISGPIAPKVGQPVAESATVAKNAQVERPAGKILGKDVRELSDANIVKFAKSKNKKVSDLAIREQAWRKASVHSAAALNTAPAKPEQSASQPTEGVAQAGGAKAVAPWKRTSADLPDWIRHKAYARVSREEFLEGMKLQEATYAAEHETTWQGKKAAYEKAERRFNPAAYVDLYDRVVKPAKPAESPKPAAPVMEPWQMTKDEYVKEALTEAGFPALAKLSSNPDAADHLATKDAAAIETWKVRHRQVVQSAIAQGKPVPANVLAGYHDLAKPAAPVAEPTPERPVSAPAEKPASEMTPAEHLRAAADKLDQAAQPNPEARPEPAPRQDSGGPDVEQVKNVDVGENLWYNRRNFTGKALAWDDIKNLNDTLKIKEVIKSKVWPRPDYEQLVTDGMQPIFARLLKQVYDGIATTPAGKTDADLQRYIATVGKVRDAVFGWAKDNNANREFMNAVATEIRRRTQRGPVSITSMIGTEKEYRNAVLDRVWPNQGSAQQRFARGSDNLEEARAVGGNRALKHLQFTMDDMVDAMKDLEKGWPKSQEAWQRQGMRVLAPNTYTLMGSPTTRYVDGKSVETGGMYWRIEPKEGRGASFVKNDAVTPDIVPERHYVLIGKRGAVQTGFDTEQAAIEAAREATKRETKGGEIRGMNIAESERTGPDRRATDENVTSDRLMIEFGFRGVNFGREGWINQNERQAYLNAAYDGLLDLAEVLDIPPKALSLNGMLGIAFGAQGRGGHAAAHFVPGVNEINLTKTMGAGTLAHEWGHALDHYFATQGGMAKAADPFVSEHAARIGSDGYIKDAGKKVPAFPGVRPEISAAFKTVVEAMNRRAMTPEEIAKREADYRQRTISNLDSWIKSARKDIEAFSKERDAALTEFDQLATRLRAGDVGDGYIKVGQMSLPQVVGQIRLLVRDKNKGGSWDIPSNWKGLAGVASSVRYMLAKRDATVTHVPQETTSTAYQRESFSKDKEKGGKRYWATEHEMFARAFETYVADQLAEREQKNTFLSDAAIRAEMKDREGKGYLMPYPRGDERKTINEAFGKLVGEIETRETDKGVEMYSQTGEPGPGLPAADIRAHIAGITEKLSVPVTIYDDVAAARADGAALPDDTRGFAARGRLSLVAENIKTLLDAEFTLFHELFHVGIRTVAKQAKDANAAFANYTAALNRVAMANPEVRRRAKAWRDKYGAEKAEQFRAAGIEDNLEARVRLTSFDEAIADMAGKRLGKPVTRLNELIAALQRLVRALGFDELANWMESVSSAEVLSLIRSATQAVSKDTVSFGGELAGETMQSRLDQTQTAEFKAWFKQSKVPGIVYHSTGYDFTTFDLSDMVGAHFGTQQAALERGVKNGGNENNVTVDKEAGRFEVWADNELQGDYATEKEANAAAKKLRERKPIAAYLSIQNPLRLPDLGTWTFDGVRSYLHLHDIINTKQADAAWEAWQRSDKDGWQSLRRILENEGYDGIVYQNDVEDAGSDSYIAFRPEQIKSAIGNRGTFSPGDPDIMHARAGGEPFNAIQQSRGVANAVSGLFKSPSALGPVNFFNTPFHKAEMLERKGIPGYKRVFQRLQLYLNDISGFAVQAEQLMPSIMRELKGIMPKDFRAYFKGAASEADIAAIGPWLNHGTLYGGGSPMEGVVWTDDELRGNATRERPIPRGLKPLTAAQIPLYRQARAGIGQSLETSGKAVIHRHVTKFGITFDRDMSLADVAEIVRDQVIEKIETLQMRIDRAKDEAGTTFTDSRRLEAEIKNYQGARAGLHDLRAAWEKAKAADDKASKYVEKLQAEQATLEALRGDTTEEADRKRLDREKANPGTIRGIAQHAKALIDHGYMPLKRFGNKTVTAYDEDGNTKFFGAYDGTPLTPGSANREMLRVAAEVKALHPEWRVVTGTRSEKAWKMYQGLSMDALENFLDFLDPETKAELERDKTIQEYLKNAVNDHSVLKQLIHRKGTPGFSTDVPRILASFVTSHARNASGLYHLSEAKRLVGEIPDQYGTVKDEAAELVDYVTKPGEEAAVLRSFLFFNFLGGSVAAAAINLTQTVMTTAPYLSQYTGVGKLTVAIGRAGKLAVGDPAVMTGELGKDLQRAELEGITAPQQIYHLAAMASNNPFSSDRRFRTAMAVWNGMFGAAEVFNRRIAFIAAHDIATERGMNVINEQLRKFAESRGEAAKRFDNAYDFAADAVDQTQFVYNKANRMNAARGPIGATVMTFKTFSVSWLELLRRLPPKQQLVMLGVLVLLAGAEGLPFEEDLADAVDTMGQWLGFTTNTGKWTGKIIRETLGSEFERPILKGLGGMLPIDLHSRLGLPNLIPGTAFAKPSEIDKTRDVAEAFGPVGGVMRNLMDGLQLMARGKWDRAALQAAPKAARDFYNGAYMMATGESQDTKGRLAMTDMTAAEGLGKLIGFNPQRAAREGEARREEMLDKNLRTVRMDEIASDWADGVIRKDQDKQKAARERMREWNRDNPELRIDGQQILRSVRERVKSARMTSQQRFLKSLPKTMRPEAREAFR